VGWASRPSFLDGRDAHPTITIKIVSYLIRDPKERRIWLMLSPGFLAYLMLQNLHMLLLQPLNLLLFQLNLRDRKLVQPKPTLR